MHPNRVTIAEAAKLLGVHPNTVRNRVRTGKLPAEKALTPAGETYLIALDALGLTEPVDAGAREPAGETMPVPAHDHAAGTRAAHALLEPFIAELGRTHQELGAARARLDAAETRVLELEAELRARDATPEYAAADTLLQRIGRWLRAG